MKKRTLLIAICCASCAPAYAQSSVTLYGIIDAGITFTTNQVMKGAGTAANAVGHQDFQATSGVINGSRWGVSGREELGGGTATIFTLESGFDSYTGLSKQGSREFGRQSFVGVTQPSTGTITLGRQYESMLTYIGGFASRQQWSGYIGSHPFDVDNLNATYRLNNAVKYLSPTYAGISGSAMFAFSNSSGGDRQNNSAWSAGGAYSNGALKLGVAYTHLNNPDSNNIQGAVAGDYSNIHNVSKDYSATSSYFSNPVKTQDMGGAAISYVFGSLTAAVLYTNTRLEEYSIHDALRYQNAEANLQYHITPSVQLSASYTFTWGHDSLTSERPRYHQLNVGADYFLSKRTSLYLTTAYQRAAGDAQYAMLNALTRSSTNRELAISTGIIQRF